MEGEARKTWVASVDRKGHTNYLEAVELKINSIRLHAPADANKLMKVFVGGANAVLGVADAFIGNASRQILEKISK